EPGAYQAGWLCEIVSAQRGDGSGGQVVHGLASTRDPRRGLDLPRDCPDDGREASVRCWHGARTTSSCTWREAPPAVWKFVLDEWGVDRAANELEPEPD